MTSLNQASIVDLSARFLGVLLRPDQSGYDEVRRVHNGMIDRRPALIAGCLGNADIVDAVNFARTHGLELAVRGGGHNVAGRAVCDDGLMLDMSLMKGIHVDPVRRTARAQGGVTWREFNRETQAHGLATTGGVISTTGIAGLTLGGGLGWLMAKHGLAMDNLVSAEVVTASGDIVRASKEENADLFWGLQGGGGNFGAVSWLEYRLHPVGTVTSGLIAHPFDRARDVLKFFREITSGLPDDLTIFGGLLHAPDGAQIAVMIVCHCGPLAEAETALEPIKKFGSPILDSVGPTSYEETNKMLDAGFPRGALNYWKSNFMSGAERSGHRHLNFAVRVMPLADERPVAGAHSRRSDACRRRARQRSPTGARAITFWSSPSGSIRLTMRGILRGRGNRMT